MTNLLSSRVQAIKISPTLAISSKAAQLKASGQDVITLAAGEPDFPTPTHICNAAIQAISEGFTRYTPVHGIPELRKAIADKLAAELKVNYSLNQIVVSTGAKQAIYNFLQAVINPGDEVLIPAPYWVSYPDMTILAGGVPVAVPSDLNSGFRIDCTKLKSLITPKTKVLILNSPSNPTGVVYSKEDLMQLAEILRAHPQILVMSDDIYEQIVWQEPKFCSLLHVAPDLAERTLIVNGVSKSYAMTGWRIGYAAGPIEIIQGMINIQSQSTSNPCSISQRAALAALTGPQDFQATMVASLKARHDYVLQRINQIPGMHGIPVGGAFYSFFSVEALINKLNLKDDVELAGVLLDQAQVAFVPGSAFGLANYLRLSFATSMQELTTAFDRVEALVTKLLK